MRILVLSDSHRYAFAVSMAIKEQYGADIVVYLGDGEDDFDAYRNEIKTNRIYSVAGNNDYYSALPTSQIIEANGVRIYITHGHKEHVKYGNEILLQKAKMYNCSLVLYGHTHRAKYEYVDGIHLFCPGALKYEEYGVADITDNGIMCINMKCR